MSARPPTVSVVMAVFNGGEFLDASIRSVHRQAFQDWEFLIIDDASTDGSAAVAERWAEIDKRIRVIPNAANKGQTACLNQGLREARGKWIARQDADDLSHPLRLTRQVERVACEPDLALVGTCGRIIDENSRLCGLLDVPLSSASLRWSAAILNPFLHTSVMFRREIVLGEFGGYDGRFRISQDYDLWARVIARHPSANLSARLVCYRNLAASLSKVGRPVAFEEAARVSEGVEEMSFGRSLSPEERRLLAAFREGVIGSDRRRFWDLHRTLVAGLVAPDRARLIAAHHLKVAGSLSGSPAAALAEVFAALRLSPRFVVGWLTERLRR
ncbi:MAG: glycosyltransferase [Terrimicrobiaceae bacterium]